MADQLPRRYEVAAKSAYGDKAVISNTLENIKLFRRKSPGCSPILTLKHLSMASGVPWIVLRNIVSRSGKSPYHVFTIPKRHSRRRWSGGKTGNRRICAPKPWLMKLQRYLVRRVLSAIKPHGASTAFAKGCNLREAVLPHCGCEWLIKLDVKGFFESISEISVYRVFLELGYQPLVAFELSRLCTRGAGVPSAKRQRSRWLQKDGRSYVISNYNLRSEPRSIPSTEFLGLREVREDPELFELLFKDINDDVEFEEPFDADIVDVRNQLAELKNVRYRPAGVRRMGYLPQGAPTSPMLANLVVREMDAQLTAIASKLELTYTRYADDIAFSTIDPKFGYLNARRFIREVYTIIAKWDLLPNLTKTRILGPGTRKVVLGLIVNPVDRPRLPRVFHDRMRMHFYYIEKYGPITHAKKRAFPSVLSLRRHIEGLINFANDVDEASGANWLARYRLIKWPI